MKVPEETCTRQCVQTFATLEARRITKKEKGGGISFFVFLWQRALN